MYEVYLQRADDTTRAKYHYKFEIPERRTTKINVNPIELNLLDEDNARDVCVPDHVSAYSPRDVSQSN
jgi:hypothetical protein